MLFLVFLYLIKNVLGILLFAIIIASAVGPFADWLDKKGFPRILGILFLYLIMFGLVISFITLTAPFVAKEVSQLSDTLPPVLAKISASLENVQKSAEKYFDVVGEAQALLDNLNQFFQESSQSAISFVVNIFGGVVSFFAIIILSFYLSVMKNGIESFLRSAIPQEYEDYVIDLWKRSELKLGRWLQGQILLALIVGIAVYIGLSLLGIHFALIIAVMAMFLELIPTVGPVIAAVPAVFLGFVQSPDTFLGLWVILLFIVVQQLENHVLVPIVMGKAVGLNPVIVILALLIGAQLGGIPGLLISVPLATIIVEFFNDVVEKRGKKTVTTSAVVQNIT